MKIKICDHTKGLSTIVKSVRNLEKMKCYSGFSKIPCTVIKRKETGQVITYIYD